MPGRKLTRQDLRDAAEKYKNWGKWGPKDEIGTLNHTQPEDIVAAARLVKKGKVISLALNFDNAGPQGAKSKYPAMGRINPVHTMLRTGTDAYSGVLDHRGIRAADDMVVMPLQCGTQWDGLGHVFYENSMWNGYDCREVTSSGAQKCGIEKHAAADHPVLGLLDAAFLRAARGDFAAIVSVPHGVFVENVAEPVPLRAALERHHHHVVGRADAAVVEHARIRVGARAQHRVHGVDAPHRRVLALRALRPGVVEVERERDHLALLHQPRRSDDVLGLRVVEGPDFVLGAPLAPVLVFLRSIAQILSGELAAWHRASFCVVEETGKNGEALLYRTGGSRSRERSAWRRAAMIRSPDHRRRPSWESSFALLRFALHRCPRVYVRPRIGRASRSVLSSRLHRRARPTSPRGCSRRS